MKTQLLIKKTVYPPTPPRDFNSWIEEITGRKVSTATDIDKEKKQKSLPLPT